MACKYKYKNNWYSEEEVLNLLRKENSSFTTLYNNLLGELETSETGRKVFEQVKRDYQLKFKPEIIEMESMMSGEITYEVVGKEFNNREDAVKYQQEQTKYYTLEEQQEEAIVTLLGMMATDKLDAKKDATLISKLKELWKQISDFVKSLLRQDEIKIDELPITTTLNDLAEIMAYGNNKIILPGYKVEYATPLGNKYDTLEEVNNEIRGLADANVEVDLSNIKINYAKTIDDVPKKNFVYYELADSFSGDTHEIRVLYNPENKKGWFMLHPYEGELYPLKDKTVVDYYNNHGLKSFIEKNKEYEQSKEIIEQWKKENNIVYDPEEVYSRGQGFYSSIGAYSNLELDLLLKNLIQHIQDNKKAGGEFTISAFTKPIDRRLKHIEGTGDRVRFVIYPKSEHIKWAAPTDVYSGSVWDAHEKVSKDKKSELLGVSFTKAPALRNINEVSPNLADIIDNLSHAHNELGIELTTDNFRIEYDDNIDYSTKKLINNYNKILDDKYGKLEKPEIKKQGEKIVQYGLYSKGANDILDWFDTKEEAQAEVDKSNKQLIDLGESPDYLVRPITKAIGKQPTQTRENTTSIESVHSKVYLQNRTIERKINDINQVPKTFKAKDKSNKEVIIEKQEDGRWIGGVLGEYKYYLTEDIVLDAYNKSLGNIKEKEYTSQAEVNLKVATLKEVARKYPRSLITSEVVPINPNIVDNSEIQYSKVGSKNDNIKPGVAELFEQNPELSSIGTPEIFLQKDEVSKIIGQANIKAATVLIDNANQKKDGETIYHEYAHHYIAWFRETPLVQEAIKKWGSEEALVQAIGEQSVKQNGEAWDWWKTFVKWLQDKFSNLSSKDKEELKNILTDAFLEARDLETGEKGMSLERQQELVNRRNSPSNENGFSSRDFETESSQTEEEIFESSKSRGTFRQTDVVIAKDKYSNWNLTVKEDGTVINKNTGKELDSQKDNKLINKALLKSKYYNYKIVTGSNNMKYAVTDEGKVFNVNADSEGNLSKSAGNEIEQGSSIYESAIKAAGDFVNTKEEVKPSVQENSNTSQATSSQPGTSNPVEENTLNISPESNENAFLSNSAVRSFVMDVPTPEGDKRVNFISVEQAFYYYKALLLDKPNLFRNILRSTNGTYLKSITNENNMQVDPKDLEFWNEVSPNLLVSLMYQSFAQNPEDAAALDATGDATLTNKLRGKERDNGEFAKALTEVRERIRNEGILNKNDEEEVSFELDTSTEGTPVEKAPKKATPSPKHQFTYKGKSIPTDFELSEDQAEALKKLIDFHNDPKPFKNKITLQGSAGTGKTSIIKYLEDYIGEDVLYGALTHSATVELAFAIRGSRNNYLPMTVASMITTNRKTGEMSLSYKASQRIGFGTTIVIDEVSMLSDKDYRRLTELTKEGYKVIFMGDAKQIPEPSSSKKDEQGIRYKNISKPFTDNEMVTLKTLHRTSNKNLQNLLSKTRESRTFHPYKLESNTDNVHFTNDLNFKENYKRLILAEPEDTVYIAYKNRDVAAWNKLVREKIVGHKGILQKGDKIIGYLGYASKTIEDGNLANSVEYMIEEVTEKKMGHADAYIVTAKSKRLEELRNTGFGRNAFNSRTTFYFLPMSKEDNIENKFSDDSFKKNNEYLSSLFATLYNLREIALNGGTSRDWGRYYNQQRLVGKELADYNLSEDYIYSPKINKMVKVDENSKEVADAKEILGSSVDDFTFKKGIDYGYGITVHKSQGKTIKNTFFDATTVPKGEHTKLMYKGKQMSTENQALYYVGISRTQDQLYVNQGTHNYETIANEEGDNDISLQDTNNQDNNSSEENTTFTAEELGLDTSVTQKDFKCKI